MYKYDMLYMPATRSFLVISGFDDNEDLPQIARFKDGTWSEQDVGKLNTARKVSFFTFSTHKLSFKNPKATRLDNEFVVAGGWNTPFPSESCKMNDKTGKFECVDIAPVLTDYVLGVSFAVSSNFCV